MLLLAYSILVFALTLWAAITLAQGQGQMGELRDTLIPSESPLPTVSIIIPACNEEKTIAAALDSVLAIAYTNLEIIVINDRSTDNTGEILKKYQEHYPQIITHEITELPTGWLGKNHALHVGAQMAKGKYLLFTDADIHFEKTTLLRAITYVQQQGLDHLSLVFKNTAPNLLLKSLVIEAGCTLFFLLKPWLVKRADRPQFMGVGAFNLVKKEAYHTIGGHSSIAMHPIDDIMLGKVIKRGGLKQDCLMAYDFITVDWYDNVGEMANGLMKNIFALYNFRLELAIGALVFTLLIVILPFWALFITSGIPFSLLAASLILRCIVFIGGALKNELPFWLFPAALITPYLNVYIMIKSVATNIKDQGINWRGTHYPLSLLRKNPPLLDIPDFRTRQRPEDTTV